ncbi:MAG: HflC protein [Alphaproteobacteria bacterium]|jgi:membrane protease subunit HflC|nr:HflC protein [Alphaproteobacteria bacterium]|tara:strand:- start:2948 stop:3811 length:864 start_codon:yes stop_codon:yes gene_type:complete
MNKTVLIFFIIALSFLGLNSLFTMDERQQGLVLQFGEPKRVIQTSGLHFKLPLIQNVVRYDVRILEYDLPIEEVIAVDKKRMLIDSFTRFKITDPLEFYKTVGTESSVRNRLNSNVISSLRRVVGRVTLEELLSEERSNIMENIKVEVNNEASRFGIEVVDVRIRRADLPEANSQAIYERMISERVREAKEFRAKGSEIAQKIRAEADKERTVILAEATKKSEILRGEGESQSVNIYANAFQQDPEFYSFYRSMQAYGNVLGEDGTTMILSPDSEFLEFFNNSKGGR